MVLQRLRGGGVTSSVPRGKPRAQGNNVSVTPIHAQTHTYMARARPPSLTVWWWCEHTSSSACTPSEAIAAYSRACSAGNAPLGCLRKGARPPRVVR